MSNNLQGLSHLAVPSPPGRTRSTMSSPSDADHATPSIYSYPSGFAPNAPGGESHPINLQTSTGRGMNTLNGRPDHASSIGSLSLSMYSSDQHGEPWNPMRVTYDHNPAADRSSFPGPNIKFGSYRQQQIPDIESVVGPRSDSGYFTHAAPHSVISNEPERVDQELPPGMFEMPNLNVSSATSESTEYIPPPSDQASVYSGRSQNQSKSIYVCSKCKEVSKCPSDYKYVQT
jgi:hypothetical protein